MSKKRKDGATAPWVEMWSEKHQRPYFVNKHTKETKWDGVDTIFEQYDRVCRCRKRKFPDDWNHVLELNRFVIVSLAHDAVKRLVGEHMLDSCNSCVPVHLAKDEPRLRVLDVGCGKGADLQKWLCHGNKLIGTLHGIDGSALSVRKANANLKHWKSMTGYPKDTKVEYAVHDLRKHASWSSLFDNHVYDIISAPFVLPYFFSSQKTALSFFTKAANACRQGGVFLTVYPSEKELAAHFFTMDRAQSMREIGTSAPVPLPDWYDMRPLTVSSSSEKFPSSPRPPLPYSLQITGTVESVEHTVPEEALREVLHKTGWRIVVLENLQAYRYKHIGWQVKRNDAYSVSKLYNVLMCTKK